MAICVGGRLKWKEDASVDEEKKSVGGREGNGSETDGGGSSEDWEESKVLDRLR